MPIFEYVCLECDHGFEALVYGEEKAQCPKCKSRKTGSAAFDLLRFNEKWNVEPAANRSLRFMRRSGRTWRMQPPRFQLRRLRVSKRDSRAWIEFSRCTVPALRPSKRRLLDLVLKLTATVSSLLSSER